MKRRTFIRSTGLAAAGSFIAPYILPSGRLFAASGARKANHVVFCLYAGGVRNFESTQKSEGNLMPNILNGTENINPGILGGIQPLPASPLPMPLQNYGTLFREFRYAGGPTGHFNGHTAAITGVYTDTDLNLREHPEHPTVFEYYRKHNTPSPAALNAWWISDTLGPYPALNYSRYPGYGSMYGANFIAPTNLIGVDGYSVLGTPKIFSSSQKASSSGLRGFLDANFSGQYNPEEAGVVNPLAVSESIQAYLSGLFSKAMSGQYADPWGAGAAMNNDMFNVFFAEEIIREYKPELLVVNMQGVDICHSNFTAYCNNLRKADYAVAHLWNMIQSTPGMMNDTILIVAPEHGRNLQSNTLVDTFGRYAIDHTAPASGGDQNARNIFCLVAGPPSVVKQNQVINAVAGESIEIVPAIADILGFEGDISSGLLKPFSSCDLQQAFI